MRPTYRAALTRLGAMLRKRPMTAREIATELGCCRPAAYQRLRALIELGEPVFTVRTRGQGKQTGPRALVYGIRDE